MGSFFPLGPLQLFLRKFSLNLAPALSNVNRTLFLVRLADCFVVGEEATVSESVEAVEGKRRVAVERVELVGVLNASRIDFIEVRRVGRVLDFRYVRRLLLAQVGAEVDALEERVRLHFLGVFAQSLVGRGAEPQDQVRAFVRQLRLWRDVQCSLPVYNLLTIGRLKRGFFRERER